MNNKLIIFDCDGTLVDSEVIASRVFPQYWASHGVHFTEDEFKEKFIGTGSDAPIALETHARLPPNAEEIGDKLFDEALATELQPVKGMRNLLASLNIEMCVASNSSLAYVKRAINKVGFEDFFGPRIFSAEQVEKPKPAADLFLFVSSTLGYDPKDCIVIEDSVSGIKAAQNAHMKVIGFSGAGHFTPSLKNRLESMCPDYFCSSIEELIQVLT